ncbi:hypothetical protein OG416_12475 [Streptomyces longwoodensis]|nr:hypothetical protein OG416_12475 [Streptomyces longwoodensis]
MGRPRDAARADAAGRSDGSPRVDGGEASGGSPSGRSPGSRRPRPARRTPRSPGASASRRTGTPGASGAAPRAGKPPRPRPGGPPRQPADGVRPPAPAAPEPSPRRPPHARLTALGLGVLTLALMLGLGFLDRWLGGASLTAYGVLFLPVSVLTALWVRPGDLLVAPVVLPIAFAVGLFPVADGDGGPGSYAMGLLTALATQAGWLYAGTLVAALLVLARRVVLVAHRRARSRRQPAAS